MGHQALNTQQIRDLLEYVEAEAMAGVYETRRAGDTHPEVVAGLKDFISEYGVMIPVIAARHPLSPDKEATVRGAFLRDWQSHQRAMQTLRPLLDLILAVAEAKPEEELSRLHSAAFPEATRAMRG